MLLSSKELLKLIEDGVIDALPENVNAASIDVRLGREIQIETAPIMSRAVDLDSKESPEMCSFDIDDGGFGLQPNQFILAHTMETFNLPDNISSLFILRSSIARAGLEHMQAGWADAGFNGAQLTLELKNMTQHHNLVIKPGMRIGQMVFFQHEPAGEYSYSVLGNYNGQQGATAAFSNQ